jgi:hypothetical protein
VGSGAAWASARATRPSTSEGWNGLRR